MSMDAIRRQYGVPAKRGAVIRFQGDEYVIVGSDYSNRLRARRLFRHRPDLPPFPVRSTVTLHPTWEIGHPS